MATKTKTEVAQAKNTAVAEAYDYGADAGVGFETKTGADLSIPFINLLQSNSPEVQTSKDGSVRIGMMKNTVTGEYYKSDEGFVFLPVHDDSAFVEWVPRIKGGGFVAVHEPGSPEVQAAIKANGGSRIPRKGADGKKIPLYIGTNELVETYYMYGLILDDDCETTIGFAVIAFTSTKIKIYRDFITSMMMMRGKPPMYAFRCRITSDIQTNESGTFANFVIKPAIGENWPECLIPPTSSLFQDGKEFRQKVVSGMARANFDEQEQSGGSTIDGTATVAGDMEDETPF